MLFRKARKRARRDVEAQIRIEGLESRRLLSAAVDSVVSALLQTPDKKNNGKNNPVTYYTPADGYSPAQIDAAYGFNQVKNNGAGTTIAIVDAYNDPNIASDLKVFDSTFSLAAPPTFTQLSQTGGAASSVSTNAGWALEESLDVEWAHAIAPAANIVLVEAKSSSLSDLLAAVNFARDYQNVSTVSMSWGSSEFTSEQSYASDFTTPAGHIGVTFVAASGDEGTIDGPEWPASSANVLAVGGTSLYTVDGDGDYGTESSWYGSTGGVSSEVPEPAYQDTAQSSGARTNPDVSYDADPNTGFAVYDSIADGGYKGWQEIGGTSAGAPQWAALISIANGERIADGLGTLDGASQTLPTLYSIYSAPGSANYATYTSTFHDINDSNSYFFFGGASAGYDYVTGLGSPDAPAVVKLLVNGSVTLAAPGNATLPKAPHWTMYRFGEAATSAGTISSASGIAPAAVTDIDAVADDVRLAPAKAAAAGQIVAASPAPRSRSEANSTQTARGSVWYAAMGVFTADVAAATKVENAVKIGLHDELTLADSAASHAAGFAASAPEGPHIGMQLAQLDASIFADSLRAFARESAALEASMPKNGWSRMMAAAAGAIVADTILVGYWYWNRSKRRAKPGEGAAKS